jgi:hypothetical protein
MKQATFQIDNQAHPKKEENVKHTDNTLETQKPKQITSSIKPIKIVENVYYLTR